jgi:hypothetical protein
MLALLHSRGIATDGKHRFPGWINIRCPFCGDRSNHLGWNINGQYWTCYRCGGKHIDAVLAELFAVSEREAWLISRQYALRPSAGEPEAEPAVVRPSAVIVPGADLLKAHRDYLDARGYDADRLAYWQLQGTDHRAAGTNKFRIVCPVYYDGEVVSWQGRDITGKSALRWKSCPQELERRPVKHCLGGLEKINGDTIVIVEGFTDAWRLGVGSCCTFGTNYLMQQIQLMIPFKRKFVVLDSEEKDPNAKKQAEKLCNILSVFPGETVIVELDEGDPGSMKQDDADSLMRSFGFKR